MKENYDNNKEFKITIIFPSKIYMCFLLSLVSKYFTFPLSLFTYRKNMVSTNNNSTHNKIHFMSRIFISRGYTKPKSAISVLHNL